jgi:hypothetical protein
MSRHQTRDEIELNQREEEAQAAIDKLEMQEAALEFELGQDIAEPRKIQILHTLRVVSKALLIQQKELTHIKDMQIKYVQMALRAYGADWGRQELSGPLFVFGFGFGSRSVIASQTRFIDRRWDLGTFDFEQRARLALSEEARAMRLLKTYLEIV